jgi:hypothetical protein
MYAGAGSADITNWARPILVMDPTDNPNVFRFIAAKRASRIGWFNEFTQENEHIRHFAHGANGHICWHEATSDELKKLESAQRKKKDQEDLLALIPPLPLRIFRPDLVEEAQRKNIGENRARRLLLILLEKGEAEIVSEKRSGTKNAEYVQRTK